MFLREPSHVSYVERWERHRLDAHNITSLFCVSFVLDWVHPPFLCSSITGPGLLLGSGVWLWRCGCV